MKGGYFFMINDIYDKYIKKYKKIIMLAGSSLIILIILVITFVSNIKTSTVKDNALLKDVKTVDETKTTTPDIYYYVDIKGAVVNPGVYQLKEGSRITDVITYAGGLTQQADTSILNQSKKLTDEMTIIIYTKDEIASYKSNSVKTTQEVIKYIEADCNCPDPEVNDACISNDITTTDPTTTLISLNTGTKEDFMTLSGLGEVKANAIISYRSEIGTFTDINQLKDVSGIGDSTFDKIKNYITI